MIKSAFMTISLSKKNPLNNAANVSLFLKKSFNAESGLGIVRVKASLLMKNSRPVGIL